MYDCVMLGMAQFLDCNFDSDEDFEETSQQGRKALFFLQFRRNVYFKEDFLFLKVFILVWKYVRP